MTHSRLQRSLPGEDLATEDQAAMILVYPANVASNDTLSWNIRCPDGCVMSRDVSMIYGVAMIDNGLELPPPGQADQPRPLQPDAQYFTTFSSGLEGPRHHAIASSSRSLDIVFGSQAFHHRPDQITAALDACKQPWPERKDGCAMLDQCVIYPYNSAQVGPRCEFTPYWAQVAGADSSRNINTLNGSVVNIQFPNQNPSVITPGDRTVTWEAIEPIEFSPFFTGDERKDTRANEWLPGVTSLQIVYNFDFRRFWSSCNCQLPPPPGGQGYEAGAGATLNLISSTSRNLVPADGGLFNPAPTALGLPGVPKLYLRFKKLTYPRGVPRPISFPVERYETYYATVQTTNVSVSPIPQVPMLFDSGLVTLSAVPSRLMIFTRRSRFPVQPARGVPAPSQNPFFDTVTTPRFSSAQFADSGGLITSLGVKWGNTEPHLTNYSPQDLYRLSKENGLSKAVSLMQFTCGDNSVEPVYFSFNTTREGGLKSYQIPGPGSIILIKPSDVGVEDEPGTTGYYSMRVQAAAQPILANDLFQAGQPVGSTTVSYELIVVAIFGERLEYDFERGTFARLSK